MAGMTSGLVVATSGMYVQDARLRIAIENIANADTAATAPGEQPYARKMISFRAIMDRESGVETVGIGKVLRDTKTQFPTEYRPNSPGADANGMVQLPNVEMLVEMSDAREASRSYEANLSMYEQSKNMILRTIDVLRA